MPPPSRFDQHFSFDERAKLAAWLEQNPTMSVDDFHDHLAACGLEVARSTAGKEKQRLEETQRRLRNSRSIMSAIDAGLDGQDDSKHRRALLEMMNTIVFDHQEVILNQNKDAVDSKDVARLAISVKNMLMAARYNQDFAQKEREIRAAADAEAAEKVRNEATRLGLSGEVLDRIDALLMPEG